MAYGLMELMAARDLGDAAWSNAKARMDLAVGGSGPERLGLGGTEAVLGDPDTDRKALVGLSPKL